MIKYKLVILDYDGTMVGKSGVVANVVKEAIKKTTANGVKVSISTGRSVYALRNLIKDLKLDEPHVFLAGALIYNPIKDLIIKEEPIDPDLVKEANEFSLSHNLYVEAATIDRLYYNIDIPEITDERKKVTGEADGLVDLSKLAEKEKIFVMRFFINVKKDKKLVTQFRKQAGDRLSFHMGHPFNFPEADVWNMTDIGVSKVSALRHLCEYLKIHPSETIAIGDSPIDLPLIENVGMGIAMGNAKDEVKQKAKWVTASADNDGVAVALEKFIISP